MYKRERSERGEVVLGGYFGTSYSIYINGKRKNKVIRYAKTPGGMFDKETGRYWRKYINTNEGPNEWTEESIDLLNK